MQKDHQLLVDFVPQTPYRGFAPGPHWETSVPQTPWVWSPKNSLYYTMPFIG